MSDWRTWQNIGDPEDDFIQPVKCGAWNAVFWIVTGALAGVFLGLAAWAIWGGR